MAAAFDWQRRQRRVDSRESGPRRWCRANTHTLLQWVIQRRNISVSVARSQQDWRHGGVSIPTSVGVADSEITVSRWFATSFLRNKFLNKIFFLLFVFDSVFQF